MNPAPRPDRDRILRMMAQDARAEAEMDRIFALNDAQVEQELAAGGVDLDKLRADAAAIAQTVAARVAKEMAEKEARATAVAKGERESEAGGDIAPVIPIALYRRRRVQLIAAAVATLTLAGVGAALALRGDIPILRPENTWPEPRPKTAEQRRAALLRQEARAACELADAVKCGQKLDEAKALDPGGEKAAGVVETRRMLDAIGAAPEDNRKGPGHDPSHP